MLSYLLYTRAVNPNVPGTESFRGENSFFEGLRHDFDGNARARTRGSVLVQLDELRFPPAVAQCHVRTTHRFIGCLNQSHGLVTILT